MTIRFIHTADIHLGKTYRGAAGESERYGDFFRCLSGIVADAVNLDVDFVLIAGDLFHTGQILPRTFARTIEALQPLADAGIPCIAVEGNHDWIHRRDSISWMEALSHMGYIRLLRPIRPESGEYRFDEFDADTGSGGRIAIKGLNIYGLGYIGSQAGSHVERICSAVETDNNLLLFHVGVWSYSPVEIGNIHPTEAAPLAERFRYVALGHGHKPYIVATADGRPYAFNPGSPERVNFGEERYPKGYYLVELTGEEVRHEFRPTSPRPMRSIAIDLEGAQDPDQALASFRDQVRQQADPAERECSPLLEVRLSGRVGFHPFQLGRERLRPVLEEVCRPLHVEFRNHLSHVTRSDGAESITGSLADIERAVLTGLIESSPAYRGRSEELVALALTIRDHVLRDDVEGDDLLDLLLGGDQ